MIFVNKIFLNSLYITFNDLKKLSSLVYNKNLISIYLFNGPKINMSNIKGNVNLSIYIILLKLYILLFFIQPTAQLTQ